MSFSPFSIHLSFHECLQYNSIVQSTCKMIDMILSVPSFTICPYIPSWRNIAPASAFAIEHALLTNKSPSLMNMKSIAVLLIMLGVSWEKIFYEELNFYHIYTCTNCLFTFSPCRLKRSNTSNLCTHCFLRFFP